MCLAASQLFTDIVVDENGVIVIGSGGQRAGREFIEYAADNEISTPEFKRFTDRYVFLE